MTPTLMRVASALCLVVLLLAVAAGCSDEKMAEVSGKVTLESKPVEEGAIRFEPVDGKTQTAGGEIKGGHYQVKVPVGKMKVSISVPKVVGTKKIYATPNSPTMPITTEALPAKYNDKTELTIDVKRGSNEKDWDLKAK